jgi:hypothetical protein
MMVDRAVQFAMPSILKLGLSISRVGQVISFVDIFEQEPDIYVGLYLYLDGLLSGNARVRQIGGQRLSGMVSQQAQPLAPPPEVTQSVAIEHPDPKPALTNSDDHWNKVPLSSVLLTVRLNQILPGMLQGLDSETNESTGAVDCHINDLTINEELQPEVLEQSRADCLGGSQFMDVFAMLGE